MQFHATDLCGVFLVEPKRFNDDRGFFAEIFHQGLFEAQGLPADFVQSNLSHNRHKGTLRGLHSQKVPYQEVKLVRCVRGSIWDVAVDIRPDSLTYKKWFGTELTAENRLAMYIPTGFLHGFISLEDDTEVLYQVSAHYQPDAALSARYDDPAFKIAWPIPPTIVSPQDQAWPYFS